MKVNVRPSIICQHCNSKDIFVYQKRKPANKEWQYFIYCKKCNKEDWIGKEAQDEDRTG